MKQKTSGFLLQYSKIILLAIIVAVASISANQPLENIFSVIMSQAPYMLIYSFGMTLAIITGGLDLSIGSVAAFSSYVAAIIIISGQVVLGLLVGLAIGAVIGIINGILIAKLKLPSFIATYGINWVIRGFVLYMLSGKKIFGFSDAFKGIAQGEIFQFTNAIRLSNPFLIAVIIFLILWFVLKKTTFGRNVYAIGANVNATRITGINTQSITMIVYMASGMLAAVAGMLYASVLDCAEPHIGTGYGLLAIAATLIGGTSIAGGKGGVGNTIIGVLIIVFLANALLVVGVSHLWQDAVFGLVIILAALMEKARQKQMIMIQD